MMDKGRSVDRLCLCFWFCFRALWGDKFGQRKHFGVVSLLQPLLLSVACFLTTSNGRGTFLAEREPNTRGRRARLLCITSFFPAVVRDLFFTTRVLAFPVTTLRVYFSLLVFGDYFPQQMCHSFLHAQLFSLQCHYFVHVFFISFSVLRQTNQIPTVTAGSWRPTVASLCGHTTKKSRSLTLLQVAFRE